MKIRQILIGLTVFTTLVLSACKSEFEKIRAIGDPAAMYKRADEYYAKEEYQKAQALYELVISSFRGRPEAEEITFRHAYTYYYTGQYILAAYYFKNFVQTYNLSPKREEADFLAAYSNYQMSPSFRLDQSYSEKAIDGLQLFISTYPQSERVKECNRLIDEMRRKQEVKAMEEGRLYFEMRQYQAAIRTYENLLRDFPETENIENIRYQITRAAFLLASNSFVEKQETRYREALAYADEFVARFPNSRYRKEAESMVNDSKKKLKQLSNVGHQNQSSRSRS